VLATLKAIKGRGGDCRLLAVLPTFHDQTTRESKAASTQLREHLGAAVWDPIHRATILRECVAEGVTIFERAPESRTAAEYAELAGRILDYGWTR